VAISSLQERIYQGEITELGDQANAVKPNMKYLPYLLVLENIKKALPCGSG
jgi:hypothetical protein